MKEIKDICRREGLEVVEVLDGSSSKYIAHVRTPEGQEALLKADDPKLLDDREIITLEAWSDSGVTPRILKVYAPGIHLREWEPGHEIGTLPDGGADLAFQVGEGLRKLHIAPNGATAKLPPILDWVKSQKSYMRKAKHLSSKEKKAAVRIITETCAAAAPVVVLHGDAYHRNILHDGRGIRFIDPRGFLGPAAFDLACHASLAPSQDPLKILDETISGYGAELEYVREFTLFLTLRSIERFRGKHGLAGHESEWRELAARLMDLVA